jgi:hypothetical protein
MTPQLSNNKINYILLLLNNMNIKKNINGPYYFYKIHLNGPPDTVLFDSFVDSPVFFNPPVRSLSRLDFKFVDPRGNEFNFFNLDHSFTLEITTINNIPENTNINTFLGRI